LLALPSAKDELLNEICTSEVQFKVGEFKLTHTYFFPMSDSLVDSTFSTLASKVAANACLFVML
jgi:hypothetical protein